MTKDDHLRLDRRQLLGAGGGALLLAQNAAQAQTAPGTVTVFADTSVLVTADRMVDNVALAIVDGKIAAMGPTAEILPKYPGADIYDGRGKAILPGLINLHGHLTATIERGFNEDYGFPNSLAPRMALQPARLLSADENALMAAVALLEAIKCGTTSMVQVAGGISGYAGVLAGSGLRLVFAESIADSNAPGAMSPELLAKSVPPVFSPQKRDEGMQRIQDLYSAWHGKAGGRISVFPSASLAETSSPELLQAVRAFAEKYDLGYTTHLHQSVAEGDYMQRYHGMSPTAFLAKADYLGPRLFAAHCRYLDDSEVALMGKSRTMVTHQAPMAADRGVIPPIPALRAAGCLIANGTDNNTQDIFEVMRIALVTERIRRASEHRDAQPLPGMRPQPEDVFEDCTRNGAIALRQEKALGSLEIGKTADLIVIDTERPHLVPYGRFLSAWIHNGQPSDTESVMVDGAFVMRNRKILTMDEAAVTAEASKVGKRVWAQVRAAGPVPVPGRGADRNT